MTAKPQVEALSDDPLGVRGDFRSPQSWAYFDTPATSTPPLVVEQAVTNFHRAQSEGPLSLPDMLAKREEARQRFASMFGASPHEIGFLFATGEAENMIATGLDLKPGDNVVVDELHYTTSFVLYRRLQQTRGIDLRIVPAVAGRADVPQYEPFVDQRTRLVSVTWVSNQNGYRHDVKGLAELAHAHGAYIYVDGIQAMGAFPADLHDTGIDFLASGTYKWLLGTFGLAAFYIREEHQERFPPDRYGMFAVAETQPGFHYRLHDGGRRYEHATPPFAQVYELAASLEYLAGVGLDRIETYTVPLAHELRRGLLEAGLEVITPEDNGSAIVTFLHGTDPEAAMQVFERRRVAVSLRGGSKQIRTGVALFNNRADVEALLAAAEEVRALPRL